MFTFRLLSLLLFGSTGTDWTFFYEFDFFSTGIHENSRTPIVINTGCILSVTGVVAIGNTDDVNIRGAKF